MSSFLRCFNLLILCCLRVRSFLCGKFVILTIVIASVNRLALPILPSFFVHRLGRGELAFSLVMACGLCLWYEVFSRFFCFFILLDGLGRRSFALFC